MPFELQCVTLHLFLAGAEYSSFIVLARQTVFCLKADESLYFNTAGCDVRSVHIREGIHESSDQVCLRHINGEFEISICLLEPIDVLESPAPVKMDRFYAHHDQPVGIV